MKPRKSPLGRVQAPSQASLDRAAACAAYDRMIADPVLAPRKPPPYNFEQRRVSAAELALRADVKAGVW